MDKNYVSEVIRELNDYFIKKLEQGDFKHIKSTEYTVTVEIDDMYFKLWMATGSASLASYDLGNETVNIIKLKFTKSNKESVYEMLKPLYLENIKNIIKEKEDELNDLRRSLSE